MFRWFLILLVAVCLAGGTAWYFQMIPTPSVSQQVGTTPDPGHVPVDIGLPLYAKVTIKPGAWQSFTDPKRTYAVISDCQFEVIDKQDVTSIAGDGNKNGLILFIGEEVPSEDLLGKDSGVEVALIKRGPDIVRKKYRRWKEGDMVKKDQMLAMVDPSIALTDCLMKRAKITAAQADWKASEEILKVYTERVVLYQNAKTTGGKYAISMEDFTNTQLTRDKYAQEVLQKMEAINLAVKESEASDTNYYFHEIRNKIPGESIIKFIYKNQGEGVKNLEPIMQLYNISKLRAQGSVESQYFGQLKKGQRVIIEPSQDVGVQPLVKAHQGEITAVAVCGDNQRFVTGSEDKTACVWRCGEKIPIQRLKHGSPVRSVACAPKESAKPWCAVGCADGTIYLWDLNNLKQPAQVLRDQHRDAVTALAFSPNGTWFASGGNDGQINLLKTADGTLVYPFDSEHGASNSHQGPITSLHFTPQDRLVSASRDQSLRVWDLGQKGARLHGEPITGRGASVNQLGVSQDGQWMLFDQGKTLQVLSVETGDTVSELKNPINAPAFETLAIFSPDGSLMLTAGASEGRLQLWRTPTSKARGFEVRQLVTTERSPVTCAAFSPNAGLKADGFAVTGTKDGYVYLWSNPTEKDLLSVIPTHEELQGFRLGMDPKEDIRLTLVDQATDSGKIRIGVDLENPRVGGPARNRFIPGQRVTVVVVEE